MTDIEGTPEKQRAFDRAVYREFSGLDDYVEPHQLGAGVIGRDRAVDEALKLVGLDPVKGAAGYSTSVDGAGYVPSGVKDCRCEECISLPQAGCRCEHCVELRSDMLLLELDLQAPETKAQPVSERRKLLAEAAELVDGKRDDEYGDPSRNFRRIAGLWTSYLDGKSELTPADVAAMMVLLKVSRLRESPDKRDTWLDIPGYAACGWDTLAP